MAQQIRGAFLGASAPRQISEKFKVQEIYLDCSRHNEMTGEKYENYVTLQVINDKVDFSHITRGLLVNAEFFVNGRFYSTSDGSRRSSLNLNLAKIEPFLNTAGDTVTIAEEQLGNIELPA